MHSPRIRIPSQSAKATIYKSWTGAKQPKSSASKPLQDEIEKFKILSRQCEEENNNLLNTLSALNTIDEKNSQTFLIDQFENELNQISKRIDKRSILINSIEKKSSRKKEATFRNQDIFQEKTQLIAENEQLVSKALFLEKKMIAAKLKLRLSHDHRDFCRLKKQFSRLVDEDDDSNDEEMEIYRNKEIIKNLKNAIEHEKARLLRVNAQPTLDEDAAEIIQKVWRGYRTRKSLKQSKSQQVSNENSAKEEKNSLNIGDAPFDELDNSDGGNGNNEEGYKQANQNDGNNEEPNQNYGNSEEGYEQANQNDGNSEEGYEQANQNDGNDEEGYEQANQNDGNSEEVDSPSS